MKLFDRFAAEIWEMAVQDAADPGCKNVCEIIAGFARSDMPDEIGQFKNLMVWNACEKVAREITDDRLKTMFS